MDQNTGVVFISKARLEIKTLWNRENTVKNRKARMESKH